MDALSPMHPAQRVVVMKGAQIGATEAGNNWIGYIGFGEAHKTKMLAEGEWHATVRAADPGTIGFHISALYSPLGWYSWQQIARDCEACQGNDEAKRSFKNTVLGETWFEPGEAPDCQRLYDRREDYRLGTVPMGGLILTAGADVQKDRIEVSVCAWGRGLESWLIDHIIIDGNPTVWHISAASASRVPGQGTPLG